METLKIAGNIISITEDGYLTDFSQWDKTIANEIAKEEGIDMTNRHWEVITWIQNQVQADKPLSIRGIKKSGLIDIKEFYALFPKGPLKVSTKIAGVPKPKSCI
jgi:TusE/DsrC/DsvC family sulfur relay protein